MSATNSPFGFRPVDHPTGNARAKVYQIASGYATTLYKGTMVTLNTSGTITISAAAADFLGIFMGCEYVDSTGKPTVSNFWPASTTVLSGTTVTAYVLDDEDTEFEVQSDGSVAQTAIGDQADVTSVGTGSTSTGLSTSTLNSTLVGAGVQGQWRIIGFGQAPDNAVGDAFTVVRVKMARSQYRANKTAI